MNISEFLNGQELTVYANKRLETKMDLVNGKLSILFKTILPIGFLILLNKVLGNSFISLVLITVLTVVYLIVALMYAKNSFRKISKKERLNSYHLEELANETEKIAFIHENIPFDYKSVEQFEKIIKTITDFRKDVSCEFKKVNLDYFILVENQTCFKELVFTDNKTKEQFLVSILIDSIGNVKYYTEYAIIKDCVDHEKVTIKNVADKKSNN